MKENKEKELPILKVQLRGGFSDRNGIDKINTEMQIHDFDNQTRIAILNTLNLIYEKFLKAYDYNFIREDAWKKYCLNILSNIYYIEVESPSSYDINKLTNYVKELMRSTILNDTYNHVIDIIEYALNWLNLGKKDMNNTFEKEYVGYRFIENYIMPITDENETKAIEESLSINYDGCKRHIQNASRLLADRNKPDYKNSIKESISAVEAICKIICNDENATLGAALKKLENKRGLRGPLKSAFEKLYAYTNDKGGIRHSEGLFVSDVTFEEAKFMLVSCCAFANYLTAEYGKIDK